MVRKTKEHQNKTKENFSIYCKERRKSAAPVSETFNLTSNLVLRSLGTWQDRHKLLGDLGFTDDDVYRSLEFFAKHKGAMIRHLHKKVESLRKAQLVYVSHDVLISRYCDNILARIGSALDLDMTKMRYKVTELDKLLAKTRKTDLT